MQEIKRHKELELKIQVWQDTEIEMTAWRLSAPHSSLLPSTPFVLGAGWGGGRAARSAALKEEEGWKRF